MHGQLKITDKIDTMEDLKFKLLLPLFLFLFAVCPSSRFSLWQSLTEASVPLVILSLAVPCCCKCSPDDMDSRLFMSS